MKYFESFLSFVFVSLRRSKLVLILSIGVFLFSPYVFHFRVVLEFLLSSRVHSVIPF